MPCFLHYITVLIENSTLLSEYGRFLTAIFYSVFFLCIYYHLYNYSFITNTMVKLWLV